MCAPPAEAPEGNAGQVVGCDRVDAVHEAAPRPASRVYATAVPLTEKPHHDPEPAGVTTHEGTKKRGGWAVREGWTLESVVAPAAVETAGPRTKSAHWSRISAGDQIRVLSNAASSARGG